METTFKKDANNVKNLLLFVIENNKVLTSYGKNPHAFEITGQPGLGKTAIAAQAAAEAGMLLVKLNPAQFSDNGDLLGAPIRTILIEKGEERQWVPVSLFKDGGYAENGWTVVNGTSPRTENCEPAWLANVKQPIMLLLDDWTRANQDFMQSFMDLILCQTFGGWKLPEGSIVVLTSNIAGGDMQVAEIDNAMRTRFRSVELGWDINSWAEWAENNHIDGRCINFMIHEEASIFNPKSKHAHLVNPRTMCQFFDSFVSIKGDYAAKQNALIVNDAGQSTVGPEVTALFQAFIKHNLDKIPQPKEMYDMDEKRIIPILEDCCKQNGEFSNAISSMLATRFVNYSKLRIDNKEWKTKDIDRFILLLKNQNIFKEDSAFYIARALTSANDAKYKAKFMPLYRDAYLSKALIS